MPDFNTLQGYIMGFLDSVKITSQQSAKNEIDTETMAKYIISEMGLILNEMIDSLKEDMAEADTSKYEEFKFPANCIQEFILPHDVFLIRATFFGEDKIDYEFQTCVENFEEDMKNNNIDPTEYEVVGILHKDDLIVFEIEKTSK